MHLVSHAFVLQLPDILLESARVQVRLECRWVCMYREKYEVLNVVKCFASSFC